MAPKSVNTLANAIVYTKMTSKSQFKMSVPQLNSKFKANYNVLTAGKHCFLLSVINPPPRVLNHMSIQNQATTLWKSPSWHYNPKSQFVMKLVHDGCSLNNKIKILANIQNAQCLHLPELVWVSKDNKKLKSDSAA
jgi:hypothetical protein